MHQRYLSGASPSTRTLQLFMPPFLFSPFFTEPSLQAACAALRIARSFAFASATSLSSPVFLIFLNYLFKPFSIFSFPVPTLDEAFGGRDSEAFHDTTRAAEPLFIAAKVVHFVGFFIEPTFDFPVPLLCYGALSVWRIIRGGTRLARWGRSPSST